MLFRLLNSQGELKRLNLLVKDNGKRILEVIKEAVSNQVDGQSIGFEDEIYIDLETYQWFSSGEGYPNNYFLTVSFELIGPNAATGTIEDLELDCDKEKFNWQASQ